MNMNITLNFVVLLNSKDLDNEESIEVDDKSGIPLTSIFCSSIPNI